MSARGTTPAGHAELRLLLPWLANGTLAPAERAAVEAHLGACGECRAELELCRRLAEDARRAEEQAPAPHPVQLARLRARLERPDDETEATAAEPPAAEAATPRPAARRWPRAARWTVAAQAAALVLFALALLPPRTPGFRVLGEPPAAVAAAGPRLRVVFDADLPEARLRELLREVGAEIVAGPSPLGVYTLAVDSRERAEPVGWLVEHLRAQPGVRFVEPVGGGATP